MSDERSVFERLDSIEATSEETNKMVAKLLGMLESGDASPAKYDTAPGESLQDFLKRSRKSWRWFGTKGKFSITKMFVIISIAILMIMGIISTIISCMCFNLYSTFTLFENAWIVVAIFYLIYAIKAKYIYEVNELSRNTSRSYKKDHLGMIFLKKEKPVFKVFLVLAIIAVLCNIIVIWTGLGKNYKLPATIFEILFLILIIVSYLINMYFFDQYSIIWVVGFNKVTKEKIVLVLPPGASQLMPEEDFKKRAGYLYK